MGRVLVAAGVLFMASAVSGAPPGFPGLVSRTYTSTDGIVPVPDDGSIVSVITIDDLAGGVVDVDVALDLPHTNAADLDISLVSPSGTTITLVSDDGRGNDDVFAGTVFDDQAASQAPGTPAPNARNFVYVDGMPAGSLQPEEALGALAGESANGPWALVVVDDSGGETGVLRGWSLTVSVLPTFHPDPPTSFTGTGGAIPDNDPAGLSSPVTVRGLGPHVHDVNVTVDIRHPNAADIDLFLTAPSGRQIELVTDVGRGNADLFAGTTFDDQAGTPIGDLPLPPSGTAFGSVVGEGALAAFLGENPNGTWTLTVVDDSSGNRGTLAGWTLAVSGSASVCGDGALDPGEQCDDGNTIDGDGCDATCTPGSGPRGGGETDCGNCVDDDGNGLVDAADPACPARAFELRTGSVVLSPTRGRLRLGGRLPGVLAAGPATLLVAGAGGPVLCGALGDLQPDDRGVLVGRGALAGGIVRVKVKLDGTLAVRGERLALPSLDDPQVTIGFGAGAERFVTSATFRARGRSRRVNP